MRVIKLSEKDEDFKKIEGVHDYFQNKLSERIPQGQFLLTTRTINEKKFVSGELLIFSYKGEIVYLAESNSGRLRNEGEERERYPDYFSIDIKSIEEGKGRLRDLEDALDQHSIPHNKIATRGWSIIKEDEYTKEKIKEIWNGFKKESLIPRGNTMAFDEAWQLLKTVEPKALRTKTGEPFAFEFRGDKSIVFRPRDGQGNEKPQSKERFSDFFHKYFVEGKRSNTDFRNLTGKRSPSGAFSYFMAVFNMIESYETYPTVDIAHTGVEAPERVKTESYRFIRDTAQGRWLKALYEWKCQLCGTTISLPGERWYAESHHVKPLGRGHAGPDVASNIIIVCPNHHVMLDFGVITLAPTKITEIDGHKIGPEFIEYHNREIYGKRQ